MRWVVALLGSLVGVLALAGPAVPQAPGYLDMKGYKIDPTIMYCLGPGDRVGPCGGPTTPLYIVNMPAQGAGGGLSVYRVYSPAGAAPMVVKAAPGRLFTYNLCNTAGSSRYLRFYNTAAPVVGTTQIFAGPIVISASSCKEFSSSFGLSFMGAISFGITSAPGDTDRTPIEAGDITGFVGFL